MKLENLILETQMLLNEAAVVAAWAKKFDLPEKDVNTLYRAAEQKAGKGNYGLIQSIFNNMFKSVKEVNATKAKTMMKKKTNTSKKQETLKVKAARYRKELGVE